MQEDDPGEAGLRQTAELQSQMERIGGRFLDRVLADFDAMDKTLQALRSGDAAAAGPLEMFAHRIHGSSAIFGFAALSEAAGALETLLQAVQSRGDAVAAASDIAARMADLRAAVQVELAARAPNR